LGNCGFDSVRGWPSAKHKKLVQLKPSLKTISLRLPVSMIEDLKVLANRRDVPYQSLPKSFSPNAWRGRSTTVREDLKTDKRA
jgi:hypothetical protein